MLSRRDKVDCHVSQVPAYFSAWKKGAEDDEMAKLFQAILVKVFVFFLLIIFRVAPALLRQATYGSLKLGFYHAVKRRLVKNPKGE